MAAKSGICTNIGNCTAADSRKLVELEPGQEFICPECGKPLLVAPDKSPRKAGIFVGMAAGATILGALAIFTIHEVTNTQPKPEPPSKHESTPAPKAPHAPDIILRLQGSNTIGAGLAPQLAQAYLVSIGNRDVTIETLAPDEAQVIGTNGDHQQAIAISAHGSATAFQGLLQHTADIGMASRPIKRAEAEELRDMGDMTSPSNEHVLALDGIAVIVNRSNKISSLAKDTVGAIFSGIVRDWSQVGGSPGGIHIYARDQKSGTFDTFAALVLGRANLDGAARRFEDSGDLASAVAADPFGIGFVGLPYVGPTKAVAISEAGATSLLPNRLTVGTEDYPLSRRLFLYIAQANANPHIGRFVEFALSREGQEWVNKMGFVPLIIRSEEVDAPKGASAHYQALTAGALRLSTNFRFRSGVSELDNRALRDLDRVADFMSKASVSPDHLIVLGFADNRGQPSQNLTLSKERAQAVAVALSERGIRPGTIAGFGSELPVADNSTDDGREKNRRVEAFVRQ
jgi:phosphate transport system substrate-binding protein